MASEQLLSALDNGILTITLNNPEKANALSPGMQRALRETLGEAARDLGVRVVVVAGAGKHFCSGGDVSAFGKPDPSDPMAMKYFDDPLWSAFESRVDRLARVAESSLLLHRMGKPTIAMLRGAVAGAGLSIATACDFRIASESLTLTTAFAKVGASGDYGGSYFITQLVGSAKARELYFLSEKLNAAEAHRVGLVNTVVADDALEAETMKFAMRLADGPPIAWRNIKQNINAAESESLETVIGVEARNMVRCTTSEDSKEAVKAFLEKRTPTFKGL